MAFWRLFYHCVWATKERLPLITALIESDLYRFIQFKVNEYGCIFHAVGGIDNHIHLALSIPPDQTISATMKKIKGSSTHFMHYQLNQPEFTWQRGYGVCSFSERHLPTIHKYIINQKQHHAENTLLEILEITN